MSSLERFLMKVDVEGPMILDTSCWVWTGATFYKGYGNFAFPVEGKKSWVNIGAHRYLWELSVAPIPDGMKLCHKCDNPPCVRPSHMFVGTQKQNLRDMTKKGRRHSPQHAGNNNPAAKLGDEVVREIRERYATGETTNFSEMGRDYNVTPQTIRNVVLRRTWDSLE